MILLFATTLAALTAEELLLEAGLDVDVVPKPPGEDSLCGIALQIDDSQLPAATTMLEREAVAFFMHPE